MPQQALSFYNIINVERKEESGEEKESFSLFLRVVFVFSFVAYK